MPRWRAGGALIPGGAAGGGGGAELRGARAQVMAVTDEWVALRQRAQAVFVREALRRKGLSPWEGFVAFDADSDSKLSPAELYGALRWLQAPALTAHDVLDFFELADMDRDGAISYTECAPPPLPSPPSCT